MLPVNYGFIVGSPLPSTVIEAVSVWPSLAASNASPSPEKTQGPWKSMSRRTDGTVLNGPAYHTIDLEKWKQGNMV